MELKKGFRIFTNFKIDPVRNRARAQARSEGPFGRAISFGVDSPLFSAIFILSLLGLLNLAGIAGIGSLFFKKQFIFFVIGIFILFLNPLFNFRIFKNYSFPSSFFFGLSAFLLFFTLQAAPIRGVTAWLHFPFGVSFETSEVVKLAMILFLARYFSSRGRTNSGLTVLISGLYSFLVIFLVFLQPDLGSAVILFLIWLGGILLLGLTKKQVIIAVNLLVVISLITGIFILEPYQKSRITSFLAGFVEPGNQSYSVLQSKIAIGSAGFWGLGFGKGSQAKFGILPEAASDFALAALVEQFGFISFALILIFYFIILSRLLYIASRVQDNFSRFFMAMFLVYFFSHVVINAGMNLGLLPVTGLPLPFISYGGSYFISLMAGFSILENMRVKSIK